MKDKKRITQEDINEILKDITTGREAILSAAHRLSFFVPKSHKILTTLIRYQFKSFTSPSAYVDALLCVAVRDHGEPGAEMVHAARGVQTNGE